VPVDAARTDDRCAARGAIEAEVRELLQRWHGPALGRIVGATDPRPHPTPGDRRVAFTGTRWSTPVGPSVSRVVIVDEAGGEPVDPVTWDGATRSARWSPDGSLLAFTSDSRLAGVHQLAWIAAARTGDPTDAPAGDPVQGPALPGSVESLSWSPSGHRLVAVVAGHGAEQAGAMASGRVPVPPERRTTPPDAEVRSFDGAPPIDEWRRAWVIDPTSGGAVCIAPDGPCVWEVSWAGDESLVAIVSDRPEEDAWYGARCSLIDVATGAETVLVTSDRQLGLPVGWPDGRWVACIEAPCSDRTLVAGRVVLVDCTTGRVDRVALDLDATHLLVLPDGRLQVSGLVGTGSRVVAFDPHTHEVVERWHTSDAVGPRQPEAWPTGTGGLVAALDSWDRAPAVVEIDADGGETVRWSGAHEGTAAVRAALGPMQHVRWHAPDGWEIEGLLVAPDGPAPHPLVLYPHGGPVASWRPRFAGGYALVPTLLARGHAVFMPNPRGSAGYGWAFADAVHGDMGGLDTGDLLSGIDHLVSIGVADPEQLTVTGGSYAGYMTCWLVTQTDRFRAAAASAPVTNWISQHFQSNIPQWGMRFLPDTDRFPMGGHVERSPVFLADRVRTPTWLSAGAHDRCCPPTQCLEFHEALRMHGVPTELVIYPDDAHNVPTGDRLVDWVARVVEWLEREGSVG
jgi:dipeptidyl aminopeptidase/acylaminoacyl peptidase